MPDVNSTEPHSESEQLTLAQMRDKAEHHLLQAIIDYSGGEFFPDYLTAAARAYKDFKQGKHASGYDDD